MELGALRTLNTWKRMLGWSCSSRLGAVVVIAIVVIVLLLFVVAATPVWRGYLPSENLVPHL